MYNPIVSVIDDKFEIHLAPVLLTWIKINPSIDKCPMPRKICDEFTHPFPNSNGWTIAFWKWRISCILHRIQTSVVVAHKIGPWTTCRASCKWRRLESVVILKISPMSVSNSNFTNSWYHALSAKRLYFLFTAQSSSAFTHKNTVSQRSEQYC